LSGFLLMKLLLDRSVPMKRLGTIDEVVKSVAYLLSNDSSYTTGTNLVVDGGLSSGLKA
jgi:NAD(P)-dependent dehydrogenase (short-subunit alcohol dehydrogenase family)